MSEPQTLTTRTLTIVLPESEWRALRDLEPDAVGWLQACIRERLSTAGHQVVSSSATIQSGPRGMSHWGRDEY